MICMRCNKEMELGIAIDAEHSHDRGCCRCFSSGPSIKTAETLELITVLKCPGCGHSELRE